MNIFLTHSHDPYYNLALEEHILHTWTGDVLLLWGNNTYIIVKRNQNTAEEINAEYIEKYSIPVVRRISGGGAVYHDLNNISFSFIVNMEYPAAQCMQDFMRPLAAILHDLGIPAELDGRNDLAVQGTKVSENAQAIYVRRMLHHGTALFDADLERMAVALRGRPEKFQSRAAKSVRARVGNLKDWLPDWSVDNFMAHLHTRLVPHGQVTSLCSFAPRRSRSAASSRGKVHVMGLELRRNTAFRLLQHLRISRWIAGNISLRHGTSSQTVEKIQSDFSRRFSESVVLLRCSRYP